MLSDKKARPFHAGKLRKEIDGVEYVEVAESKGKVFVADTGMVLRNGKLTKGHNNGNGYLTVAIAGKTSYVHRIVFEVFSGEIPQGWDVDHINDVRGDNRLTNLQVMTHYENITGKASTVANRLRASRESIKKAIQVQEKPVVCIDDAGVERWFKSSMEAARATGTNFTSISMVLHGYRIRKAGGMCWRFARKEDANV